MARLEARKKMGFYPTPIITLTFISEMLRAEGDCSILDPCCGDGVALKTVAAYAANGFRVCTYGVEPDKARARVASTNLNVVLNGSIYDVNIRPLEVFSLLYLNPPYDYEEGERTEFRFLRHSHRWLKRGGVLVFVVPEHIFSEKVKKWIAHHYEEIRIMRFVRDEYPVFKQVVMFARKKGDNTGASSSFPVEFPYIEDIERITYTVPRGIQPAVFELKHITEEEILSMKPQVYDRIRESLRLTDPVSSRVLSPLFPLRKGHLVALLMSGVLNGKMEKEKIVYKCYTDRVANKREESDENGTRVIETHTYVSGIRVIEKGRWYDVK
jgi:predicted RNA methylase